MSAESSVDSGASNVWRTTPHYDSQADAASIMVPGSGCSLTKEEDELQSKRLLKLLEEKEKQLKEKDEHVKEKDKLLKEKDEQLKEKDEDYKKELEKRNSIIQRLLSLDHNGQAENENLYEPICASCGEKDDNLTASEKTIESLATQKQQLEEKIEADKHGFEKTIQCLEEQKQHLGEEIEAAKQEFEKKMESKKKEFEKKIEAEKQEFEMKIQGLEAERQLLTEKIKSVETEKQQLAEENSNLKKGDATRKLEVAVAQEKAKEYAKLFDAEMERRLHLEQGSSTD